MTAGLCALMSATSFFSGNKSSFQPLQRAAFHASFSALAIAALSIGHAQTGLIAIILFGIPNAYYNAILPAWSAERFGQHGQGAVMGLISVTFCLANIVMALAGSVLSLLDTRLILLLGACLSAWAAWQLLQWQHQISRQTAAKKSTLQA